MRCLLWGLVCFAGGFESSHAEELFPPRSVYIRVPGEEGVFRVENPPSQLIPAGVTPSQERELAVVSRAINRELRDVDRGFRQLDQTYALRGFQGCGAATADSVFIDWRARGQLPPKGITVLPPEPIMLGIPKWNCCDQHDRLLTRPVPCECDREQFSPTPLPHDHQLPPPANH